jgi:aspartyl-tRNA synthetase
MQTRTYIGDLKNHVGNEVVIKGWIQIRRDQGKMIFFDFRDASGVVQGVVLPGSVAMDTAKETRSEWVVAVTGRVNARPEKMVKVGVQNGDIEIEVLGIEVLNQAETPPFDILSDTREINEETRLTNRYIDIRSERLQKNLRMRHKVANFVRQNLDNQNFAEVETPVFTKSTPEGARDYVVPSRIFPGNFYALPQSPQQYKQLLMAGGLEKYYQFARCMRDEDLRGDRQPEFTQLDMEMSFVDEEEVMSVTENLLIEIVKNLYPEKKIQTIPFPRIPYKEAMEKYGSDRPDIRDDKEDINTLAFCWVVDFPFFERTDKSDNPQANGEWTFTHNPFSICKPEHLANVMEHKNIGDVLAAQYDIVLNGYEIGGGSIRAHDPEILKSILGILGYTQEKIESDYGHMLKALASGTPPHGGIAWGFDRLMMILQNEPNIREVIAFPKTREGRDPMMGSPSEISDKQLAELSISINKKKE